MNLPEFSYPIDVEEITSSVSTYEIEIDQEKRQLIAKRLNIVALNNLKAKLTVVRKKSYKIAVEGSIDANVTQNDAHTLEKVDQQFTFLVKEFFSTLPEGKKPEIEVSLEEEGEPLLEATLDLGELIIQCLSLQLDPYPKNDSAGYLDYIEDQGSLSPFHQLKESIETKPKKSK